MLGGIGLGAPAGPDSADVALDLNAGAEEPIAAQLQGPYRLEVKDRHSGFPLATEEQVNEHLSTVLEDMNSFCGHWCIARIDGARVQDSATALKSPQSTPRTRRNTRSSPFQIQWRSEAA